MKIILLAAWAWLAALPAVRSEPFSAICAQLAAEAERENRIVVPGLDGWLFLTGELRHIGAGPFWGPAAIRASRAIKPDETDPLPVIVNFHQQLAGRGIELLVVPVPPKGLIYPDKLVAAAGRSVLAESPLGEFYSLLRAQGIQVLDLAPRFWEERVTAASNGPALYCRQDSHWSGHACGVAAQAIAEALAGRPWLTEISRREFMRTDDEIELQGDLWQALTEPRPEKERLSVRRIQQDGQPVAPDPAAPILLLGDSHVLVLHAGGDMQTAGAGLADQLAAEFGFPIDVLGVRGSGATPARISLMRRARANPNYLAGKKLVVWCFSAREFTEATAWLPVPLSPPGSE